MKSSKMVITHFATHFNLSSNQILSSENDTFNIKHVPYVYVVASLMYVMVCTRPCITHVVGTVSRFLSYPSREH